MAERLRATVTTQIQAAEGNICIERDSVGAVIRQPGRVIGAGHLIRGPVVGDIPITAGKVGPNDVSSRRGRRKQNPYNQGK